MSRSDRAQTTMRRRGYGASRRNGKPGILQFGRTAYFASTVLTCLSGTPTSGRHLTKRDSVLSQDSATLFDSRGHRIYDGKIVGPKYEPGLKLPLTLKNVRLVLSEADAAIVPMPLVGVVHDRMIAGIAASPPPGIHRRSKLKHSRPNSLVYSIGPYVQAGPPNVQ